MPSIVTHHLFAQSFDNLFYYHFFTSFKNPVRTTGKIAQRTKTNEYFLNILNYLKKHQLENNPDALGYLFGSICHYALDSTCHPFVIYQTGSLDINKKYRGGHEKMEVMIDAIMYEKKEKKPLYKEKLSNILLPKVTFSNELNNILNYTFNKTFNINNMGPKYEQSAKTGHLILKYFVTDRTGIKKQIYKLKDKFGQGKMYQYLSFHIRKLDMNFLNLEHHNWCYPTDNSIIKNSSFYDLYDEAILFATKLFNVSLDYLNNVITEKKVTKEFRDLSYVTGLDWHLKTKMQYFKN